MNSNNYLVIMAGGVGARFWPHSRVSKPKQFIDILGIGKTLIQLTFERFSKIIPAENVFVVTSDDYLSLVKEQLPMLQDQQILLEPIRRNTAPCIAYANNVIAKRNPLANIVVAPSDHLIIREAEFLRIIEEGLAFTAASDVLLTIGIKPTRPETGYGYIQVKKGKNMEGILKVKTFTEKPNLEMARVFLDSGEFFWNSGIFVWSLKSIMKSFSQNLTDIDVLFRNASRKLGQGDDKSVITETYEECRSISVDYGIMEKADNVYVYCADLGWSDLGTWGSLYEHSELDDQHNAILGGQIISQDNRGCIIRAANNRVLVVRGLEDYLVVESEACTLIMPKGEEQSIRDVVDEVRNRFGTEYL